MRYAIAAILSLCFLAESQAAWMCPFLHRRECEPLFPHYCQPCPPCPQYYYPQCIPLPLPKIEKAVVSEDEPEGNGGNLPLLGYVDAGMPPTGHDTFFGGGSPIFGVGSFSPSSSFGGGFGGGSGGGGGNHGGSFLTHHDGNTLINIINNTYCCPEGRCDLPPCLSYPCPPYCPPVCPPGHNPPGCDTPCPPGGGCDTPPCGPPMVSAPAPAGIVMFISALPCGLFYWLRQRRHQII